MNYADFSALLWFANYDVYKTFPCDDVIMFVWEIKRERVEWVEIELEEG